MSCVFKKKLPASTVSRDRHVFIFKGPAIRIIARLIVTWLIVTLLLVPVIVVRAVEAVVLQMSCIMLASGLFIVVVSAITNARAAEIFMAGVT